MFLSTEHATDNCYKTLFDSTMYFRLNINTLLGDFKLTHNFVGYILDNNNNSIE